MTPAAQRTSLEMAQAFAKAGTPFVCIPALNNDQYNELVKLLQAQLTLIINLAEKIESCQTDS